jgi:23S rRNA (cytidine1920-2'-O)/16S rRNA (cytidine1409-2'-O)-methyltransferase
MPKSKKKPKYRLDQMLVDRRLCESLNEARALIMGGKVIVDDQRVDQSGALVTEASKIRIRQKSFVSRGGEKLAGALEDFALIASIANSTVLDVGCSTGGFTDCCLKLGAAKVVAVDVGTNIIDWKIRNHPMVDAREQCDIRKLDADSVPKFDVILADISFNSLQNLMDSMLRFASKDGTEFVWLLKPQFELPSRDVPEGGIVEEEALRTKALESVKELLAKRGIQDIRWSDSRVKGTHGNQEIFLNFRYRKN